MPATSLQWPACAKASEELESEAEATTPSHLCARIVLPNAASNLDIATATHTPRANGMPPNAWQRSQQQHRLPKRTQTSTLASTLRMLCQSTPRKSGNQKATTAAFRTSTGTWSPCVTTSLLACARPRSRMQLWPACSTKHKCAAVAIRSAGRRLANLGCDCSPMPVAGGGGAALRPAPPTGGAALMLALLLVVEVPQPCLR